MKLNITHVLNAAFGSDQTLNLIEVSPKIYFDNNIDFLAIEAIDCSSFGLWRHFDKSTQFIGFCIESGGLQVFGHYNKDSIEYNWIQLFLLFVVQEKYWFTANKAFLVRLLWSWPT